MTVTVFQIIAAPRGEEPVTFMIDVTLSGPAKSVSGKLKPSFFHVKHFDVKTGIWDDSPSVRYQVEGNTVHVIVTAETFSPFALTYDVPVKKSSGGSDEGTSVWATPTAEPTAEPTQEPTVPPTKTATATPTAAPTETKPAESPVPFAGVLAGLGAAAVLFGLRMRR